MNASIEKAIAPLITAGVAALIALATGGAVDITSLQGALLTAASGLVAAGAVYLVNYSATKPYKAIVAGAVPLVVALINALQTGEINQPELLLLAQGLIGAVFTYFARRTEVNVDASAVREGTGATARRR